jgi:hypothetical protein
MTAIDITAASLDLGILLGDWRNTNDAGGIARIVCRQGDAGRIDVQCYGRHGSESKDWGSVSAPVYSFTFESKQAGAFNAVFDLGGEEEVHVQANVKAGVLVVASFNKIKDRSGRTNYFDREFFHRIGKG